MYIFVGKPYRKVVLQKLHRQFNCVFGFVPMSNFCSHLSYTHIEQTELLIRSSEHLACSVLSSSL
jgi:phospholipid N-methyltransferase